MNKRLMFNKGMTLIEATISTALSGIVVVAVTAALAGGGNFSSNSTTMTQMRRDARYAIMHMESHVRPLIHTQIDTGTAGKMTISPTGSTSYYQKVGSTLVYNDGILGKTVTLIGSRVSSLTFTFPYTVTGQKAGVYLLQVTLTLSQGSWQVPMSTTIELRNM